jgi:hypothetical protein
LLRYVIEQGLEGYMGAVLVVRILFIPK